MALRGRMRRGADHPRARRWLGRWAPLCLVSLVVTCTNGSDDTAAQPTFADPCDAWKDAALQYFLCNAAVIGRPAAGDRCVSDDVVALRGPRASVAECADYLQSLIVDCVGLEVSREAMELGDDDVVFDWIMETGVRPTCSCLPMRDAEQGTQCVDLVQRDETGP